MIPRLKPHASSLKPQYINYEILAKGGSTIFPLFTIILLYVKKATKTTRSGHDLFDFPLLHIRTKIMPGMTGRSVAKSWNSGIARIRLRQPLHFLRAANNHLTLSMTIEVPL